MELDSRIKQAQRKGAFSYIVVGVSTTALLLSFFVWLFFVKGFTLIVLPEEVANDYSTQSVSGNSWRRDNSLYVFGSNATLRISAPTFEPVTLVITDESPPNIEITLPPSPAQIVADMRAGVLKSKTSHLEKEASWYIDNQLVHVGNTIEHQLPHGDYTLRVEHPFYLPWEQSLSLSRAENLVIAPELMPVSGELTVSSSVKSAIISIDQQKVPNATKAQPFKQRVKGGQYTLQVSADGYQLINDVIDVTWQRPLQSRHYLLVPLQASVTVNATPNGGTLLIDQLEKTQGIHPVDANESINIVYSKPGFYDYADTISVAPGENRNVDINLKPANGLLAIKTKPIAQVFIDNKSVGLSPISLPLSAITHSIRIEKPGYRTITQSVNIKPEQLTNLDITLPTEFDARRTEGKPLFIQQLGINMQMFIGGQFTMGSAPNQPGRRRNEHPIKVNLARPFWVSRHEISEKQFAVFSKQTQNSNKPMTNVTWIDAAKYANWLSEKEGLPSFYQFRGNQLMTVNKDARGYRLPTEAEWEWLAKKASRAAETTYVWGNSDRIPTKAGNFADKRMQGTQPIYLADYEDQHKGLADVGSYKADRLGLFDMAGNVSEWVHDKYTNTLPDLAVSHTDYLGSNTGDLHVTKGGNYKTGRLRDLRAAYREPAGNGSPTIGFRIARYE